MENGALCRNLWLLAFHEMIMALETERKIDGNFGRELSELDEETDYQFLFYDFILDLIYVLDSSRDCRDLLSVCETLLETFDWAKNDPTDILTCYSECLENTGSADKAIEFCRQWYEKSKGDQSAGASLVYLFTRARRFKEAEKVVGDFIMDDECDCCEENEHIFCAASSLYQAEGDRVRMDWVNRKIDEYEQQEGNFGDGGDFSPDGDSYEDPD